ncbi:cupin domain-containing protein [Streptomyces poonensis]|uniref:Cupin n=1 Tax=Streptomyces poonensis TaxID=68255 RepID=A0A918PN50_9ACTN|nr:cupin domain-containing protein [Streptomyces poonensis]GGZ16535.1 cupin [Streptomyces poonensis]GLJ90829.1 cupin [Streptomyces poonensis]
MAGDGFLVPPGQSRGGERRMLRAPMRMLVDGGDSDGAFTVVELLHERDFSTPLHVHRNEDEALYVLDGELAVVCGEERWETGPGGFVHLPRAVPHGLKVVSESARVMAFCVPSGFEHFARDVADIRPAEGSLAQVADIAGKYGIEILGPFPER